MNHYGFLFGGKMLMWVDEAAWMAVSNDFPGQHFFHTDITFVRVDGVGSKIPVS